MAINLSLNRLPWYGQLGAFVGLSVAGAAVFWYVYAQPAQARIDEQRAKLATLQEEVSRGTETAKRLPAFRKEVTSLQAQLDRLKLILPEERDVADLLRRVQAMATQSNLTIRGFTPRAITTRELHAEWPIGLEVEGTYHDLGAFLERVSKFPRIINVNAITIRTHEGAGPATVTALATATTFVLIEPAPEEAAPARGRGARAGRAAGRGRAS